MSYYIDSLQGRLEEMSLETIDKLLGILKDTPEISGVEVIGGSPEQNPHFKYFVKSAAEMGKKLAVVSDLALYMAPGMSDIPELLAKYGVKILAFVSHFNEDAVDRRMGENTFGKIISSLRRLNDLGYGKEGPDLKIAIVYFPEIAVLPPNKNTIAAAYNMTLFEEYGVLFNQVSIFNNLPIGRFNIREYSSILEENFNRDTVEKVPCRHVIGVSPDGRFFDCDFYTVLNNPIICESSNVDNFNYASLNKRKIATSPLSLTCTAGEGASCAECCE